MPWNRRKESCFLYELLNHKGEERNVKNHLMLKNTPSASAGSDVIMTATKSQNYNCSKIVGIANCSYVISVETTCNDIPRKVIPSKVEGEEEVEEDEDGNKLEDWHVCLQMKHKISSVSKEDLRFNDIFTWYPEYIHEEVESRKGFASFIVGNRIKSMRVLLHTKVFSKEFCYKISCLNLTVYRDCPIVLLSASNFFVSTGTIVGWHEGDKLTKDCSRILPYLPFIGNKFSVADAFDDQNFLCSLEFTVPNSLANYDEMMCHANNEIIVTVTLTGKLKVKCSNIFAALELKRLCK